MTYWTPEWEATVKRMRSTLRRRITAARKDPQTVDKWVMVKEQADKMTTYFRETGGWPDWWAETERARDDAFYAVRRQIVSW